MQEGTPVASVAGALLRQRARYPERLVLVQHAVLLLAGLGRHDPGVRERRNVLGRV